MMRTSANVLIAPRTLPLADGERPRDLIPRPIYRATRSLLRIHSAEEAVGILIDAVKQLGGGTVPARIGHPDSLPVDISLGEGEPLLPTAPAGSAARRHLQEFVPHLAEDARVALELTRRVERLAREAGVDSLTGLPNRRTMGRLMGRLKQDDILVTLDLDHFNKVNETHGYDTGDDVLRSFSRALRHAIRASDHFGRMGGEEFLVVLQGAGVPAAFNLLKRLREHWTSVRPLPVTFSAGVADVGAHDWRQAMQAADRALFRAKESGRDRWEAAQDADFE
jgi:diguanylate cyclase (GGDEF)-like protein